MSDATFKLYSDASDAPPLPADEIMTRLIGISRNLNPSVVRLVVNADVAVGMQKFAVAGVDLAPDDARAKLEAEYCRRHDEVTAAEVVELDQQARRTVAALEARIAASEEPPMPAPTTDNAIKELLILQKYKGRLRLSDLAAKYDATGDSDPIWTRLIEVERDALDLRPGDDDGDALMTLQAKFRARRAARRDQDAVRSLAALREALTQNHVFGEAVAASRAGRLRVAQLRMAR